MAGTRCLERPLQLFRNIQRKAYTSLRCAFPKQHTRKSALRLATRGCGKQLFQVAIRWAEIAEWYRLAVEYQLLQHYVQRFGRLPKYVRH